MEFQSPSQRGGGAARTTSASRVRAELFQSPSQRGGGAAGQLYPLPQISVVFQSPSQRGGGTALFAFSHVRMLDDPRFNPLRKGEAAPPIVLSSFKVILRAFQSPSQRGGGAALTNIIGVNGTLAEFQSPSQRGGGAAVNPRITPPRSE